MERADWLEGGFDSAQARFLMVTAITHHRFSSPAWGEHEVRKLHAELAEIEASAAGVPAPRPSRWTRMWERIRTATMWRSPRTGTSRPQPLHARLGGQ
jgi:hypothetical protein